MQDNKHKSKHRSKQKRKRKSTQWYHTMVSSRFSAGTIASSWMPTSEPLEVSRFNAARPRFGEITVGTTSPFTPMVGCPSVSSGLGRPVGLFACVSAVEARYASSAFSCARRSLVC